MSSNLHGNNMRKEKLMQTILNWKFVYTFWVISYIVDIIFFILGGKSLITGILPSIFWGILGITTIIIGCFHIRRKHWIDALLYFCLFPFPLIANLIK